MSSWRGKVEVEVEWGADGWVWLQGALGRVVGGLQGEGGAQ